MSKKIIEMHSTWLVVNSVVGCTNGCKYCYLQSTDGNIKDPNQIVDPFTAIEQLLSSKFYNSIIPICLLPNTDVFLNQSNMDYLKTLLNEFKKQKIMNTIVLVTKCLIPKYFIELMKEMITQGHDIVIYLSYSGLDKTIEPNVNHESIKENFKNYIMQE